MGFHEDSNMKGMAIQQGKMPDKEKPNKLNEGILEEYCILPIKETNLPLGDAMLDNIFILQTSKKLMRKEKKGNVINSTDLVDEIVYAPI